MCGVIGFASILMASRRQLAIFTCRDTFNSHLIPDASQLSSRRIFVQLTSKKCKPFTQAHTKKKTGTSELVTFGARRPSVRKETTCQSLIMRIHLRETLHLTHTHTYINCLLIINTEMAPKHQRQSLWIFFLQFGHKHFDLTVVKRIFRTTLACATRRNALPLISLSDASRWT